jgi:hypothetical protein
MRLRRIATNSFSLCPLRPLRLCGENKKGLQKMQTFEYQTAEKLKLLLHR